MTDYDLRQVPLFAGLPERDIIRLGQGLSNRPLKAGETLFDEGDVGDQAYVIASGELEILKESGGRQVRIAISGEGDVVGEMALLSAEPRNAAARAVTDTDLIAIPKACLDDVLATSVEANRSLFDVFIARWREQESRVRQSERMAQIGVLTAGLAHEMNNPAAAVAAGSDLLAEAIGLRVRLSESLPPGTLIPQPSRNARDLSPMDRSDAEADIEDVLDELSMEDPWTVSAILAEAGYVAGDLEGLDPATADPAVRIAAADAECFALLSEVTEGAKRLSELVSALKSYSFLDQAPVQEVDVTKGIEDTILILRSKIKDITVIREYQDDLPKLTAFGSQLNQVWTNLIDNAADAIHDSNTDPGIITIRAFSRDDCIVVEIENTGPPIPPDVANRIFEAFFTTKEPGKGTGLGLDTAYSIVVTQHRGSLTVTSADGLTTFTSILPISQETAAG